MLRELKLPGSVGWKQRIERRLRRALPRLNKRLEPN